MHIESLRLKVLLSLRGGLQILSLERPHLPVQALVHPPHYRQLLLLVTGHEAEDGRHLLQPGVLVPRVINKTVHLPGFIQGAGEQHDGRGRPVFHLAAVFLDDAVPLLLFALGHHLGHVVFETNVQQAGGQKDGDTEHRQDHDR